MHVYLKTKEVGPKPMPKPTELSIKIDSIFYYILFY